jgi:hypothetical protein
LWAASEHVVDGVNYVMVLAVPLVVNGAVMIMGGAGLFLLHHARARSRMARVDLWR